MPKSLVIVESPAKAKTIEKYLGSTYELTSSKGHIRDLATSGYGGFGVDLENKFTPTYKILKDKQALVKDLQKKIDQYDKIYLATDPDREGEAISWHLYKALDLKGKNYERIVFHEITNKAVNKALENGREIDIDLVKSQESRRILDRIIGFSLSKLLQKKIGSKSAGRVQSVALKLIVEREKEIEAFVPEEYWEIFLEFTKNKQKVSAELIAYNNEKLKLEKQADVNEVLENLGDKYLISEINRKQRQRAPRAAFITSSLQQEAATKFNFTAKRTMNAAQRLYEGIELRNERVGLITYMRTDSTRMSLDFVNEAKKYILSNFGEEYLGSYKEAKQSDKKIQDAHEAIRVVNLDYSPESIKDELSSDEFKIYSIIYSRCLASLMKNAIFEDEEVLITNNNYKFVAKGEKLLFEGFLKIYDEKEKKTKKLPKFTVDEVIENSEILPEQKFTSPPSRYSEARIIKKMEDLGIGRPSTYSGIIETLKLRNYVKQQERAFVPTKQGILTAENLEAFFSTIINSKYTAQMENNLDEIAEGKLIWYEELENFYNEFKPLVENAELNMEKVYPVFLDEECPLCSAKLVIRNGRFGEFVACSAFPKCKYIKKDEKDIPKSTGVKCPNCKEGMIVERISKRGRNKGKLFYACDQYPKCKATYNSLDEIE